MSAGVDDAVRKRGCRECRRLKLGCERKWPCHNCKKRGCADICPGGTFPKGMRSTKSERLVMHETIGKLGHRMSQLEDAIEQLQSLVSTEPHPLLRGDGEQTSHPVVSTQPKKPPPTVEEDVLEALGAFSIGDKGETMFHEASAASEYLLISPKSPTTHPAFQIKSTAPTSLPPELVILSALFPFPPDTINTVLADFLPHLPSYPRAQVLADYYFANGAWSVDPVHRDDFMHRVLGKCYSDRKPSVDSTSADRLASLFMVFAVGAFFDPEIPLCPREAEDYYSLSRACLCMRPVYDYPTVYAVQAMTLMMWFQTLAGHRTQSYRPLLWGVLHTVCQLINLNRDPAKSGIVGIEAKVREIAFWEVKSIEQWQAFATGRPAITSVIEDCKQPYEDAYHDPNAREADSAVWLGWKQHWTDTVNSVADQAFRSKGTKYSQILALDKQLRHHHTPPPLRWPTTKGALYQKLARNTLTGMQCMARMILQESGLLHLHRWFFMQAVSQQPDDPLEHPFAHSVRTVYQSAAAILLSLSTMYSYHPVLMSRCKTAWTNGFSAALTLGTLVIYAPTIPLAQPAMIEFERACTLFQNTSGSSVQPENAAATLQDLLQKARRARTEGRSIVQEDLGMTDNDATTATSRSSQSPGSNESRHSWQSTSSGEGSPVHLMNTAHVHDYTFSQYVGPDMTPPAPAPLVSHKMEHDSSLVAEDLRHWWDSKQGY